MFSYKRLGDKEFQNFMIKLCQTLELPWDLCQTFETHWSCSSGFIWSFISHGNFHQSSFIIVKVLKTLSFLEQQFSSCSAWKLLFMQNVLPFSLADKIEANCFWFLAFCWIKILCIDLRLNDKKVTEKLISLVQLYSIWNIFKSLYLTTWNRFLDD